VGTVSDARQQLEPGVQDAQEVMRTRSSTGPVAEIVPNTQPNLHVGEIVEFIAAIRMPNSFDLSSDRASSSVAACIAASTSSRAAAPRTGQAACFPSMLY
jgi:hypothetical protein